MSRKPDLVNKKKDLALWLNENEEGRISISINHKGKHLGTVKDFNNTVGFRQNWHVYILECVSQSLGKNRGELYYYVGSTWNLEKRWLERGAEIMFDVSIISEYLMNYSK